MHVEPYAVAVPEAVWEDLRDRIRRTRWHGTPIGPADAVRVPTAMAVFANEFVPEGQPPRSWYERRSG